MAEATGTLTAVSVDARIRRFEAANDLLRLQVDGWCVWPLFRFGIVAELMEIAPGPGVPRATPGRSERIPTAIRDLLRLLTLRPARRCVLVFSGNRTESAAGRYRDIFFDDLLLEVGDFLKIEVIDNRSLLRASRSALIGSDLTTTGFEMLGGLISRIAGPAALAPVAEELGGLITRDLGLAGYSTPFVARRLRNFFWVKRLFKGLLRRIGARELLLVTSFGSHAAVAAARELGVRTIEFQHGSLMRHHPGYSWGAYALPYRAALPVPDRIFLYGDYWKREMAANGFWGPELCPVGSLRMDRYRELRAPASGTCRIALTTQPLDTGRFVAFIAEFLDAAAGRLDLQLSLKLHPTEATAAPYEPLCRNRANVRAIPSWEEPSTFALLAGSDVHASISSTCHYEALALGLPTVILPLATHDEVLHLTQTGHAFLARTPREMLDIVLRCRARPVPPAIGERFFRAGALENMKRELLA